MNGLAFTPQGRKMKAEVVPSLMREVENRISRLSSIKAMMEKIEAVHGETVESMCNGTLEEEHEQQGHQTYRRGRDGSSSTPDIMSKMAPMGLWWDMW